jgi:hypothetical protein
LHEVVATVDELDCSAERTVRAMNEPMEVFLHQSGGKYVVQTDSGSYQVDVAEGSCNCDDWKFRKPDDGCKHVRRVRLELACGRIPRPDGRLSRSGEGQVRSEVVESGP